MSDKIVRAVVFDLDGLLIDSEPLQFAAWDAFVKQYGRTLSGDLKRRMYGTRLVDSSAMVAAELNLPISSEQVAFERDGLFFEMIPGNIRAKPGATYLLNWLSERNIPVALATSGHRQYVDVAMQSAGIPGPFSVEVTGDLVVRGKPDPETFLTVARLLGVDPHQTLVLEDSPQGVQAAIAAGAICFAIPDDPVNRFIDLSGAHKIVPSLAKVPEVAQSYGLSFSNSSHG